MKGFRRNYAVVLRALTTHFVVAVLLAAVFNTGSVILYRSMRHRLIAENDKHTQELVQWLDNTIHEIDQVTSRIVTHKNIVALQWLDSQPQLQDQYLIYRAKKSLEAITEDIPFDFYIYLRSNDILLSKSDVYYNFEGAYGPSFSFAGLEYGEFVNGVLARGEAPRFLPVGEMRLPVQSLTGGLYIRNVHSAQMYDNAVMFHVLDKARLQEQASLLLSPGHTVQVYSGSDPLVWTNEGGSLPLPQGVGLWGNSLISVCQSAYGLTVYSTVGKEVAFAELAPLRVILVLLNLLAVTGVLLYITHLARRYSRDLSDVITALQSKGKKPKKGLFVSLNESYASLLSSNSQMEAALVKQEYFLRSVVLRNLMNGSLKSDGQLQALLDRAGMNLLGKRYIALLIQGADLAPQCREATAAAIQTAFSAQGYLYQPKEDAWFVLIGFTGPAGQEKPFVQQAFRQSCLPVEQQAQGGRLLAAASPVFTSLDEVCLHYNSCRLLLGRPPQGSDPLLLWAAPAEPDHFDSLHFTEHMEARLTGLVKSGNRAGAEAALQRALELNFVQRSLSPLSFKLFTAQLQLLFYRCALGECYELIEQDLFKLERAENRDDLLQSGMQIIETLTGHFARSPAGEDNALKIAIERYIRENFSDPGLSLKGIAANFSFSESYFSTQFKELIGENFSSYLDKTRITYADSLVRGSTRKIEEIARLSGYHSANTFHRAYKRYFGVPPSTRRRTGDTDPDTIKESLPAAGA